MSSFTRICVAVCGAAALTVLAGCQDSNPAPTPTPTAPAPVSSAVETPSATSTPSASATPSSSASAQVTPSTTKTPGPPPSRMTHMNTQPTEGATDR